MRLLRSVKAPVGLVHLQDPRRGPRTLCGRGVFFQFGWRVSSSGTRCSTCSRIARRRYR